MSDVVIVGAGLAGLVCAQDLTAAGLDVTVLEAADGVGGRVRTDVVDGYRLDRGFQILLTAYPEVQRRIDLTSLRLGRFEPGARVWRGGSFHRVADPMRRPAHAIESLRAPIGTLADKLRVVRLVADVRRGSVADLLRRDEASTLDRLRAAGFSSQMIDAFWRPLFSGIQLDPGLEVSSRRFDVILRMLAVGGTGVPAEGMGAIPAQLAASLPPGCVRLGARVAHVLDGGVRLDDGEVVDAAAVVVATDGPSAHRLLGGAVRDPGSRPVACCWFAAAGRIDDGRLLHLDGDGRDPAPNVAVLSAVAPSYAPEGRTLVAAAVPGPGALAPDLAERVAAQLGRWFGSTAGEWQLLRTDRILHGQPVQAPPFAPKQRVALGGGRFVCGDHRDTASIQGAMFSGERAAVAVLGSLRGD